LSGSNFNVFRDFPALGRTRARQTFASIVGLRRMLGAASPSELLLYGLLPTLTVCGALVSLAIPMVLGPARFGQYSLVEALCRYGMAFDLGLSVLVDRRLPVILATHEASEETAFVGTMLWLRLYIALAALSAAALLLPLLSAFGELQFDWLLGMTALVAGVLGMLVNGPTSIERARSHRQNFTILYAGALAVLSFGRLLGVVAGGVMGCFVVMGLCYGALALNSYWGLLRGGARPKIASAGPFFRESAPLFLTMYIYALLVTANRWVIASQTDTIILGQFAFGSNVSALIVGTVAGMGQLWYPRLVKRRAMGEDVAVSRRVMRDLVVLAVAMSAMSAVGIVLGPWLIGLVYPKFRASQDVVQIILASVPASTIASWLMPLALATGAKPWLDGVLVYTTALLVLVTATVVGFRLDGIMGASWGMGVCMPALAGLQLWRLCARQVLRRDDAAVLFIIVMVATAALALLALWT
jgi:O-antigen/teichoic acid export membrane protein